MKEYLEIVNENDEVIGLKPREEIHRLGLLHREVHVYYKNKNNEIIFQRRAKDKDTYPDLLDATVGGHVEKGDSYVQTAIKEALEETGIMIKANELILINKVRKGPVVDKITKKINNVFRVSYLYSFEGDLSQLKVEKGKAQGFEAWGIDKLIKISKEDKENFIPYVISYVLKVISNKL